MVVFNIKKQMETVLLATSSCSGYSSGYTHSIVLQDRHIPGYLIVISDHLSRQYQPITMEWSLLPNIMALIFELWGLPTVDIVTTIHNTQLSPFHVSNFRAQSSGGG